MKSKNTVTLWGNWRNVPRITSTAAGTGHRISPIHDIFCPHVSKITVHKLNYFIVKVLPLSPFSSELLQSDNHLFKHFDNFLTDRAIAIHNPEKMTFVILIQPIAPNFNAERINQLVLLFYYKQRLIQLNWISIF